MPDKVAICVDNIKLSYGALANRISATVTNIRDNFDLRPQSRVILFAEKNVDFVVLYFALHCLNVIVLPIDVNISTATFVNIRKEVSPGLIVGNVTLDGVDCRIHRFDEVVMDNCLPCKMNVYLMVTLWMILRILCIHQGLQGLLKVLCFLIETCYPQLLI